MSTSWVRQKVKGAVQRAQPRGGKSSAVRAHIETPSDGQHIASNYFTIGGWAFSYAGAVTRVEVRLDQHVLGEATYGLHRPDVTETFHLSGADYGFTGEFEIPSGLQTGQHRLTVVTTDTQGNSTLETQTLVLAEATATVSRIFLAIDRPTQNTTTAGTIEIVGWTFCDFSPIESVVAHIDGQPAGALVFGQSREDVYAVHRTRASRMSGFSGRITAPTNRQGSHRLTVHVTTRDGATASETRTFVVVPGTTAHMDVERAAWVGDMITVSGWAVLPGMKRPWTVSVFAGETLLGAGRVKYSRPDIRMRFPDLPGSIRSGFEMELPCHSVAESERGRGLKLLVRCTDPEGRFTEQRVFVQYRPDDSQRTLAAWREDIEDAVWQVRIATGTEPAILNLTKQYPFGSMLKTCNVFTLPAAADATPATTVTSGVADVVISDGSAKDTLYMEAATYASLTLQPGDQRTQRAHATLHWNPRTGALAIPSVSVIIPVYNKISYTRACVERVLETVRPYIALEVLVIDDCSNDETQAVITEMARADARVKYVRNETNLGFLRSSNHGAKCACGDILVFLNNDTLPESRWLEPLLATFRTHHDAGAVGGKLMYPDGTLQEAGGIVFSDASGSNFGRNDPYPEHPLFNTLREVDYCSGALLATPRTLFAKLEMFDERYVPAYFEDSDYCFKVREAGLRVYYQPESAVIHFEGVSNGRDTNQGIKHYQVINHDRFVERWAEALQRQGPPPDNHERAVQNRLFVRYERERDPVTGAHEPKRALVVYPSVPDYNHEGGARQHSAFIDFLQDCGWNVTLVSNDKASEDMYTRRLRQRGVQVYFGSRCSGTGDTFVEDFAQLVRDGNFQLALFAPWVTAEEYLPVMRALSPETRIFVNTMDLHFLRNVRHALTSASAEEGGVSFPSNLGDEMIRELTVYANADLVTTVSDEETTMLRDFMGKRAKIEMLRHTEPLQPSTVAVAERQGMLFVGNFRHSPNIEAVEYLLSEVVPLVDPTALRAHPITIIGTDMPASLRTLARDLEHVHMLGWVPSVTPYLYRARVNLVPLLYGAGTKVKLIQALLAGTPSVTTTVGAEGLALVDGQHVLIADTPERFAQGMSLLATDDALWARLALGSRNHIEARHGTDAVRARFSELLDQVMGAPSRASIAGPMKRHANIAPRDPK